ncbi:hypothetical protein D3C71_78230 [compost metagenome]
MTERNLLLEDLLAEATTREEVENVRAWLQSVLANGYRMDSERRAADVLLKMLPTLPPPEHQFKFALFDFVVHKKTGGHYCIVGLPDANRLEATNEPCYCYKDGNGVVWHRKQDEMEDGRFVHKPVKVGRYNCGRFGDLE